MTPTCSWLSEPQVTSSWFLLLVELPHILFRYSPWTKNDSVQCNVRLGESKYSLESKLLTQKVHNLLVPIMMLSTTLCTMEIHTCQDLSPASFLCRPSHVQNRKMAIAESLKLQLSAQLEILYRPVQAKTLFKWPPIRDKVQDATGGLDWIPTCQLTHCGWVIGRLEALDNAESWFTPTCWTSTPREGWVGSWKWIPVPGHLCKVITAHCWNAKQSWPKLKRLPRISLHWVEQDAPPMETIVDVVTVNKKL